MGRRLGKLGLFGVLFVFLATSVSFAVSDLFVPKVEKGKSVVVVFSFDNDTNGGSLNATLDGNTEIYVKLPDGVTFSDSEAPVLKSAGSVEVYLNEALDTEAAGNLINAGTAKWDIHAVNDTSSTDWKFYFKGKINVPDEYAESDVNATIIIVKGNTIKRANLKIAVVRSYEPVVVKAEKEDSENATFAFTISDRTGNYTVEFENNCVKFTKVNGWNATGNGTDYVSISSVTNSTDGKLIVAVSKSVSGVQIAVNATINATNCPVGDIKALVKDPDGNQIDEVVVAKAKKPGTEYSVPDTLDKLTRGAKVYKQVSFNMTENFADDLANGVNNAIKLVFEGLTVNNVVAAGGQFNCTKSSDTEFICSINGTDDSKVDTVKLTVNATVPYDYTGSYAKVTVSDNNGTDNVIITEKTLDIAEVVAPEVEISNGEPGNVGPEFSKCFSFNVTEKYYGSLKQGGQLVVIVPDDLRDKVEIVNATISGSIFSDSDSAAANNQAYESYDKSNAYWIVNNWSNSNGTYNVDVCLKGSGLSIGDKIKLKVSYALSDGTSSERSLEFANVKKPGIVEFGSLIPVKKGEPNYQTVANVTIKENFEDALTNGTIRVIVTGVSDIEVEGTGIDANNVDVKDYTNGKIAVVEIVSFNDTGSVENATMTVEGLVISDEVRVRILDGDLNGDNKVGIGDWENVTAAACCNKHLDLCDTQEDCINAGGYWYDDACHAESQPEPVPAEKEVGEYEGDIAEAPVAYSDGKVNVSFNYEGNVDILVVVFPCDWSGVYWLDSNCQWTGDYAQAASQQQTLSCENVQLPVNAGYIAWMVSGKPISQMTEEDWLNGAYELKFYSFGNCQ